MVCCRTGASGDVVMQGGHGFVADFLPGEYNLVDLACFTDLPPLEPVHRVIKVRPPVTSSCRGITFDT